MQLSIVGANGFLGKHTIQKAIQQGWAVKAIVRREEVIKEIEGLGAKAYVIKDFDVNALKDVFQDCKAVIHFANIVCGSKIQFEKVNIEGARAITSAASEVGVERTIYPSGLGVDKYNTVNWASNDYFRSKWSAEHIFREGKVPYVIFRPSYILGPNDELVPDLIKQIASGTVKVAGDGTIPMQPIFIENATDAFLAAAGGKGKSNVIYDLVGPKIINLIQLIQIIVSLINEMGFRVPYPRIQQVSFENAAVELGICKEMVDVMRCNITSDGSVAAKALDFELSPLEVAIKATVTNQLFPKEVKPQKKAIILLSGGIDSATVLYWAKHECFDLLALSFNYHNRPEKERRAAAKLCELTNTRLIEVPIPFLKDAIDLRVEGFPIPCAVNSPEGYIPVRNLLFYAIAAYYAEAYGIDTVMGGHLAEDSINFPDASPEFFKKLEGLILKGKHCQDPSNLKFLFPLSKISKMEALKIAKKLNVPMELTWSCYSEDDKPCGKCASCVNRKEAFKVAGFLDPGFSG